jgi:hypothetical protein
MSQYGSWIGSQETLRETLLRMIMEWPEEILDQQPLAATISYVRRPLDLEDPLMLRGFTSVKLTIKEEEAT